MNLSPPRQNWIANKWLSLLVLSFVLVSPTFLQGCDDLSGPEQRDSNQIDDPVTAPASINNKLRHAGMLGKATRTIPGQAGKDDAKGANLFLAFDPYEADGITPRIISKYEITNRIVKEYGITRRVLNKYGITKRILDKYGITRRVLNKYGITKRVLGKYGVTPRLLSKYNDHVTLDLLAENGITEATLASEGLSIADIDDFNALSALLNQYDLSIEQFIQELESAEPTVRVKVYIDGAHLGMSVELQSEYLDDFLEEIDDDSDILFTEPDITLETGELATIVGKGKKQQLIPWGVEHIGTPIPEDDKLKMKDVDYYEDNPVYVYVLDSGGLKKSKDYDIEFEESKDFTMLFENPDQLTWDENDAPDVSGFDPKKDGDPYDESGHGTHVAGTIGAEHNEQGVMGVAPGVRLHSLKVLNDAGQTDITTLLAAVDYVTRKKQKHPERPMVVNMSLGVDIGTTTYNVLDEAIAASIEAGVIYVAAAGNDGKDASTYSPAHVDKVITVGAYNKSETFSSFSNYGPAVDILAPGEDIISLSHLKDDNKDNVHILASGTSHAAPHVTGAIVRYLGQHPHATATEVSDALKQAALPTIQSVPSGTTDRALNLKALLPEVEDKKKK